jgi:hypothetical protein
MRRLLENIFREIKVLLFRRNLQSNGDKFQFLLKGIFREIEAF